MEAQRQLDEPELSGLDPVRAGLRLGESDLAGFLPGEYIEEAVERRARSAIAGGGWCLAMPPADRMAR